MKTAEELQIELDKATADLKEAHDKLTLSVSDTSQADKVKALQKTIDDMQAAQAAKDAQLRLSAINKAFGGKLPAEEVKVYSSMTEEQFAVAIKHNVNPENADTSLLSILAAGVDGTETESLSMQSAKRLNLVKAS